MWATLFPPLDASEFDLTCEAIVITIINAVSFVEFASA